MCSPWKPHLAFEPLQDAARILKCNGYILEDIAYHRMMRNNMYYPDKLKVDLMPNRQSRLLGKLQESELSINTSQLALANITYRTPYEIFSRLREYSWADIRLRPVDLCEEFLKLGLPINSKDKSNMSLLCYLVQLREDTLAIRLAERGANRDFEVDKSRAHLIVPLRDAYYRYFFSRNRAIPYVTERNRTPIVLARSQLKAALIAASDEDSADRLSMCLKSLDVTGHPPELVDIFNQLMGELDKFSLLPSVLVAKEAVIAAIQAGPLTAQHAVFTPIHALCERLQTLIQKLTDTKDSSIFADLIQHINSFKKEHEDFIQDIVQCHEAQLTARLWRPVYIHLAVSSQQQCRRRLKPHVAQALSDLQRRDNTEGHSSLKIVDNVCYKADPEFPGVEYMVNALHDVMNGRGCVPAELIQVVNLNQGTYHLPKQAYQASQRIYSASLREVVNRHGSKQLPLNLRNFCELVSLSFLTGPRDAKPDNIMALEEFNTDNTLREIFLSDYERCKRQPVHIGKAELLNAMDYARFRTPEEEQLFFSRFISDSSRITHLAIRNSRHLGLSEGLRLHDLPGYFNHLTTLILRNMPQISYAGLLALHDIRPDLQIVLDDTINLTSQELTAFLTQHPKVTLLIGDRQFELTGNYTEILKFAVCSCGVTSKLLLDYLVDNGADINVPIEGDVSIFNRAVRLGDADFITRLIQDYNAQKHILMPNGDTALHIAARMRHTHLIADLLELDFNPDAINHAGESVWHLSRAHSGFEQTLQYTRDSIEQHRAQSDTESGELPAAADNAVTLVRPASEMDLEYLDPEANPNYVANHAERFALMAITENCRGFLNYLLTEKSAEPVPVHQCGAYDGLQGEELAEHQRKDIQILQHTLRLASLVVHRNWLEKFRDSLNELNDNLIDDYQFRSALGRSLTECLPIAHPILQVIQNA